MGGNNSRHLNSNGAGVKSRVERRRSPWPLAVVAALFIIVPFFAWYGTWFGRELSDEDIEEYLKDDQKPRHAQHALAQIEARIAKGDARAKRWYPQVLALAANPYTDVRMTAAWVMGADAEAAAFHGGLLRLLDDREPIVRRNAALSLVRFGDVRGRSELRAMLNPYTITASVDGTALTVLTEGSYVKREAMLSRLRASDERFYEVRAPLAGRIAQAFIKQGDQVSAGSKLFVLAPESASVADALVGLSRLGEVEDLEDVERYARGVEGMPDDIKQRAAQTVEAIKRRISQKM